MTFHIFMKKVGGGKIRIFKAFYLLLKKSLSNSFWNSAVLKAMDVEVQLNTVKNLTVIPHGVGFHSLEIRFSIDHTGPVVKCSLSYYH